MEKNRGTFELKSWGSVRGQSGAQTYFLISIF
jgi:hypothetical protein